MEGYIKSTLEIFKIMKICMIGTGYVGLVSGTWNLETTLFVLI